MLGGATIYHDIKTHAEYLGVRGNIVIPKEEENACPDLGFDLTCPDCGFVGKSPFGLSSHQRRHKNAIPV